MRPETKKPQRLVHAGASEDNVKPEQEMNVMSKNSTVAPAVTQAAVDFHGHALTVITGPAGEHLVAMKPICEAVGLDWKSQYARIKRDEVLSTCMVIMTIQTLGDDQSREITCLPLDYLNGWLFGIDVARCREEIRPALIQYKRECYAALAAYWQQGEAVNPRKGRKPKALPNGLTSDQQESIKALVKARVEALPASKQGGAAIRCWSSLKSKFGCSYKEIDPAQFTEAISLLARLPLEGELLEGERPKQGTMLDDNQLYDVYFVSHHFERLYEIFKRSNLHVHLGGLGSTIGIEMIGHFLDGYTGVIKLKKLSTEFEAAQRRLGLNQYSGNRGVAA